MIHGSVFVTDTGFAQRLFTIGEAILDSIALIIFILATVVCRAYVLDKRAPSTVEEEKKLK